MLRSATRVAVALAFATTMMTASPSAAGADTHEDRVAYWSDVFSGGPVDPAVIAAGEASGELVRLADLEFPATSEAAAFTCGVEGFGPEWYYASGTNALTVDGWGFVGCPVQMLELSIHVELQIGSPPAATSPLYYVTAFHGETRPDQAYNRYTALASASGPCPFAGKETTRWKLYVEALGFSPSGQSSMASGSSAIHAHAC